MGGHYAKGRRWRIEERHRFYTNQLYPNDVDSATGYKEQFRQVPTLHSPLLSTPTWLMGGSETQAHTLTSILLLLHCIEESDSRSASLHPLK